MAILLTWQEFVEGYFLSTCLADTLCPACPKSKTPLQQCGCWGPVFPVSVWKKPLGKLQVAREEAKGKEVKGSLRHYRS